MNEYPFKTSHWFNDNIETSQSVEKNKQIDVVVVGGGFAGISAAMEIKKFNKSLSVAIIEAMHVGFGASGRNAGWLQKLPPLFWLLDDFNDKCRLEDIKWTSQYCNESLTEIGNLVNKNTINCDWKHTQHRLIARNPLEVATLKWIRPRFEAIGLKCEYYDRKIAAQFVSYKASAALAYEIVTINPYNLVDGLCQYCKELGIEIYEHSPIKSILSQKNNVKLSTDRGYTITANKVVLATNAYTKFLNTNGIKMPKTSAYHTYMFATEPLEDKFIEKLTVGGTPFGDPTLFFCIGRMHDNRLLFNGIDRKSQVTDEEDRHIPSFDKLYKKMIQRFPMLEKISIDSAWGGAVMQTSSDAPIVRYADSYKNLILNIGYGGGSGMGMALHSGKLLIDLISKEGKNEDAMRLRNLLNSSSFSTAGIFRATFGITGKLLQLH